MTTMPSRRTALSVLALLAATPLAGVAQSRKPFAEVWKDEGCGCCEDWVVHLRDEGFDIKLHDSGHHPMREKLGLDRKYASCHVALVAGYAIEGHVPAADIRRLLRDKPQAIGLAVPGMVVGSPGMDGPAYGGRRDPFDVLLVARDGSARVFQHHPARKA